MRKEEGKEHVLTGRAEGAAEEDSFEEPGAILTDVGVTRAQAIKLAGLGSAGFLFMLLWPAEAEARRRRRRRRRRRKARVTPTPVTVIPGATVLNVTNPSPDTSLTISEFKVLDEDGSVIRTIDLPENITIAPGATVSITITDPLVDAEGLRLIDERGVPITIVDENGVTVGDIDIA